MGERSTFCGTLEYMAPEMIQNLPHTHTLDVWCLGILLYELVHGHAPFTGSNPREIGQKIMQRKIKFSSKTSAPFRDLVEKIL
jgi:serine/threonine protein kinase